MREWTFVFTWTRLAMAGLVFCLALLLAVVILMPVQAQNGCVEWDDHGNCVKWRGPLNASEQVAAADTPTPAPPPEF